MTKAKTPETMRLNVDVAEHVPLVRGKFGCEEERTWPVSFGQNEKGGMDEEEFAEYLFNSIVPLFSPAKDKPGHRVLLKVDSGPGRKALALLEQVKPVNSLSNADLDMLLVWHQVPKTKSAKKLDKLQQWMAIRVDGDPPPAYERWTDEDEQRLVALHATNIDISDTQYRREVVLKKKELEAAADHFNREERDKLRKKWDVMDAEDVEEAITSLQEELQAEVTESTDGEELVAV